MLIGCDNNSYMNCKQGRQANKKRLYIKQNKLYSSQLSAAKQITRDVLLLSLHIRRVWIQGQRLISDAGRRLRTECKHNFYPKDLILRASTFRLFLKRIFPINLPVSAWIYIFWLWHSSTALKSNITHEKLSKGPTDTCI